MISDERLWLARPEWRDGVIHWRAADAAKFKIARLLIFLVAAAIFVKYQYESNSYGGLLILVTIGVCLFVIKKFADNWRDRNSFGAATFTFDRVPFILGGKLEGVVRTSLVGIDADTRFMLSCYQGSWDNEDGPDWRAFHIPTPNELQREGDNVSIKIRFTLPTDMRQTKLRWPSYTWELAILTGFPGINRIVTFEVPVFAEQAAPFVQETAAGQLAKREIRKAISVFDD